MSNPVNVMVHLIVKVLYCTWHEARTSADAAKECIKPLISLSLLRHCADWSCPAKEVLWVLSWLICLFIPTVLYVCENRNKSIFTDSVFAKCCVPSTSLGYWKHMACRLSPFLSTLYIQYVMPK